MPDPSLLPLPAKPLAVGVVPAVQIKVLKDTVHGLALP